MKILISGFEPFDGLSTNPSEILLRNLGDLSFDFPVEHILLPVSFAKAAPRLKEKIIQSKPTHVICLGLAIGRSEINFERVAINVMDARTSDNDGFTPVDERIDPSSPDGLFTSLPIKNMLKACQELGIPATISNSAGTYVCNQVMFRAIQLEDQLGIKAGFVHLPSEKVMSIEVQKQALKAFVNAL